MDSASESSKEQKKKWLNTIIGPNYGLLSINFLTLSLSDLRNSCALSTDIFYPETWGVFGGYSAPEHMRVGGRRGPALSGLSVYFIYLFFDDIYGTSRGVNGPCCESKNTTNMPEVKETEMFSVV